MVTPEKDRTALHEVVSVPSTWDGWAVRVLTIAVVICIISAWAVFAASRQLSLQVEELQVRNSTYQSQAQTRGCLLLKKLGATSDELVSVGCTP